MIKINEIISKQAKINVITNNGVHPIINNLNNPEDIEESVVMGVSSQLS